MSSNTILNMAIGVILVAAASIAGSSCTDSRTRTNQERIDQLEHELAYVYEVIRPRRVSEEHCESLSGGWKTCSLRGKELQCLCDYDTDEWDKASFAFQVNAKAQELIEAMEAEAVKVAAEEEQAPEKLASEEEGDEGKE